MERVLNEGWVAESPSAGGDANLSDRYDSAGIAHFDASQYAFFGHDIMEEVELGGLEDGDDGEGLINGDDGLCLSSFDSAKAANNLGDFFATDDLTSTLMKMNDIKIFDDPRVTSVSGNNRKIGGGISSGDWMQQFDFSDQLNHRSLDLENIQEDQVWWSRPDSSSSSFTVARPLNRAPSNAEHLSMERNYSSADPILAPKSSAIHSPLGRTFDAYTDRADSSTLHSHAFGLHMSASAMNSTPISASQHHFGELSSRLQYSGNINQITNPTFFIDDQQQNHHLIEGNITSGHQPSLLSNLPQQFPTSALLNPQILHRQQEQRLRPAQPIPSQFPRIQSQAVSRLHSPPQGMRMFDTTHSVTCIGRGRHTDTHINRQNIQFFSQKPHPDVHMGDFGWLHFKSKYMSTDEIVNILKMHHAATHSGDPYIEDYYHQACQAKKAAALKQRHCFRPTALRNLSSRSRANSEQHAFLQINGLGRISFSSIHRPRPLLEVDQPPAAHDNSKEQKSLAKPLEQEPMLAARIIIEDGLCILLEVDDIDRFLQFTHPNDKVPQLLRRRQVLLDGLTASLQLVDPLGPDKGGHSLRLSREDDALFLKIASLPKGRRLLSQLLQVISPEIELSRVICMTIFRHLRFLFGSLQSDPSAIKATTNLAMVLSSRLRGMELSSLSACFAALACSSEQAPFRPLGSSSGDWASMIIISVLERATYLLTDPQEAGNYNMHNRLLWQASFNSFFELLMKYCFNKYDSIRQSSKDSVPVQTEDISKKMPVEILRASIPHTDEPQRKLLQDFARRSMPVT